MEREVLEVGATWGSWAILCMGPASGVSECPHSANRVVKSTKRQRLAKVKSLRDRHPVSAGSLPHDICTLPSSLLSYYLHDFYQNVNP